MVFVVVLIKLGTRPVDPTVHVTSSVVFVLPLHGHVELFTTTERTDFAQCSKPLHCMAWMRFLSLYLLSYNKSFPRSHWSPAKLELPGRWRTEAGQECRDAVAQQVNSRAHCSLSAFEADAMTLLSLILKLNPEHNKHTLVHFILHSVTLSSTRRCAGLLLHYMPG